MQAFHHRLAEIWSKYLMYGVLSSKEVKEFSESLTAHVKWASQLQRLENLADCAVIVGDHAWEKQICEQMDCLIYVHSPRNEGEMR